MKKKITKGPRNLIQFQKYIGVKFRNQTLLRQAFVLKSMKNTGNFHNQRLEFLGDAVLDLCVVDWEFKNFPKAKEGVLTQYKQSIISNENLIKVGKSLKLDDFIQGQFYEKMYADVFESLVAAIFLDQGITKTKDFVKKFCLKNVMRFLKDCQQYKGKDQSFEKRKGDIPLENIEKMKEFKREKKISIKNPYLFQEALTPPSQDSFSNYQRLEFLGDTVLKCIISNYLYQKLKNSDEGEMSRVKSFYVNNNEILIKASENLGINRFIMLENKLEKSDISYNGLMSDMFESLIGSLYYENGLKKNEKNKQYDVKGEIIKNNIIKVLDHVKIENIDPIKNQLQNFTLQKIRILPRYFLIAKYQTQFISACFLNDFMVSVGEGKTIKESENDCATKSMKIFNKRKNVKNLEEIKSILKENKKDLLINDLIHLETIEVINYDIYVLLKRLNSLI